MSKTFCKKAGLAFFALAFSLIPCLNTYAEGEDYLWSTSINKSKIYCDEGSSQVFKSVCSGVTLNPLGETNDRYIDITMHAGEYGHFETEQGNTAERTNEYFRGDTFDDKTQPISDRPDYVFVGWSTKSTADDVNVEVGSMTASTVGTDIYAVWSNKVYVYYNIYNGVWSPEGSTDEYTMVLMEKDANSHFENLNPDPRPIEQFYDFTGWYSQVYGKGAHYTPETILDQPVSFVYSKWTYNPNRIENEMILDEAYDIVAGVSVPLYKFTPSETAYYEIYTDGIKDFGNNVQGMIRLQDADDHNLAMEESAGQGEEHIYYMMEAGTTYFIRFGEIDGNYIRFNASIRKAETAPVTFHANHSTNAWFDNDQSLNEKTVNLPIGKNIATYKNVGLDSENWITFIGWSDEAEPEGWHNSLLVEGAMDVYAFWDEWETITLDYNGGYDPIEGEDVKSTIYKYTPGDAFNTPIDPKIDSSHLKFAGWSRSKTATEPDADIIETVTPADNFKDQTLYAVYTEKVLETFIVTGDGYMMDDPSIKIYQVSKGTGHIFYGMATMHLNNRIKAMGWTDHNGVFINETSEEYPYYRVTEDTTYTVVWGYEISTYGNGGYFPKHGTTAAQKVKFPLSDEDSDTFSMDTILDYLGVPVSFDTGRYFVGWSTDPGDGYDPEVDVFDGETLLTSLNTIFAVWADDEYYVDDSSETTWQRGDETGLRVVIKRRGDDRQTFTSFDGVANDDEEMNQENYNTEEGSLILTIHSDYLNSLENGAHQLAIHFIDANDVMVNYTIIQAEEDEEETFPVPDTGVNHEQTELGATIVSSTAIITAAIIVVMAKLITFRVRK